MLLSDTLYSGHKSAQVRVLDFDRIYLVFKHLVTLVDLRYVSIRQHMSAYVSIRTSAYFVHLIFKHLVALVVA